MADKITHAHLAMWRRLHDGEQPQPGRTPQGFEDQGHAFGVEFSPSRVGQCRHGHSVK